MPPLESMKPRPKTAAPTTDRPSTEHSAAAPSVAKSFGQPSAASFHMSHQGPPMMHYPMHGASYYPVQFMPNSQVPHHAPVVNTVRPSPHSVVTKSQEGLNKAWLSCYIVINLTFVDGYTIAHDWCSARCALSLHACSAHERTLFAH